MTEIFSRRDQRQGGMDGRTALHQYFHDDVAAYLGGTFASDTARSRMHAAAAEAVDLAAAKPGDEEPSRVWFFSEASLAHETARTLWALGDLQGAETEFWRSVCTRKADTFSRTHAVTLGYLGALEAQQGGVEAACAVWGQALDAMQGVQSGRARESVITMRRRLSPYRNRGISVAAEIDERARELLGRVT